MNIKIKIIRNLKRNYRILRSFIAQVILGYPSSKLKLIGVTGTSGKSTTSTLIYHILKENKFKVGLISTVGAIAGNKIIDTGFHVTTPDPIKLQSILKQMVNEKIEYVIIESSSHALDQGRLGMLKFDLAVFTNIKRDHLDYHFTWENYADAKAILIKKLKQKGKTILNKDDIISFNYLTSLNLINEKRIITYSVKDECSELKSDLNGIEFKFRNSIIKIDLLGNYNIDNSLAAIKVGLELNIKIEEIASSLKTFKGIEGRMQLIINNPFTVIVDFAHNTDSLEQSLLSIRKIILKDKRLIVVFGSAGLRDVEKRFNMGEKAAELADVIILTAEDPRTEELNEINNKILEGAQSKGGNLMCRFANHNEYLEYLNKEQKEIIKSKSIFIFDENNINSRYDAIDLAIRLANKEDLVIVEGKGHEKSLSFGHIEYPYNDQDAVRKTLYNLDLLNN